MPRTPALLKPLQLAFPKIIFFKDDYSLDFDFKNDEDAPAVNLGHSNSNLVDKEFILVASSHYHLLINGIYYLFYFITAVKMN